MATFKREHCGRVALKARLWTDTEQKSSFRLGGFPGPWPSGTLFYVMIPLIPFLKFSVVGCLCTM